MLTSASKTKDPIEDREQQGSSPARLNNGLAFPAPANDDHSEEVSPSDSSPRLSIVAAVDRRTKIMPAPETVTKEKTHFKREEEGDDKEKGSHHERRIVGILVTYTWTAAGQLFPVREGRNFIGSGVETPEGDTEERGIQIHSDPDMSREHTLILYRAGNYEIVDQKSTNGTFLLSEAGEEMVPLHGSELPDRAVIKTGSTIWVFHKIGPPEMPQVAAT